MRIWVFLLALSFALASRTRSEEPENARRVSRLRSLVERTTQATEQSPSKRRREDLITERQFQHCGPNEVVGEFGVCEQAVVTKNVYAFTAPKYRRPILRPHVPQPKLDLNVVFVKTAPNELPPLPLVVPPTQQKTVVYLLSKTPKVNQQLIEVPSGGPVEPEVFFVNYGSGENPSLPGGIDLRTALTQTPLDGQVVSSSPALNVQQTGFGNQPVQDFSFEDENFQNSFLGQTSVTGGILSQSQGHSSNLVAPATNKLQSSAEASQQLTSFNQFQSLSATKLQSPTSGLFQSSLSSQFKPIPTKQFQSVPSNQFQSVPSNQFQPALSNQYQSPVDDIFNSDALQQQIPFANHLFESSSKNQFDSLSSQSSTSSGFVSGKNTGNTFDSSELQVSPRNEFRSKKRITTQNIHIDESNELSQKTPVNQHRTPSRSSSFSSSSTRSIQSNRYESPSNSLIEDARGTVQLLQPTQFGHADDHSNERASVKKKINALPSGFVPTIQGQPPQNTLPSRPRFKPSQSLPNRQFESPGREGFTPMPGSQYVLPPRNFRYAAPPQDQSTASADQYKAPLVVQKLEPELWEDVPTVRKSGN